MSKEGAVTCQRGSQYLVAWVIVENYMAGEGWRGKAVSQSVYFNVDGKVSKPPYNYLALSQKFNS